MNFSSLKIAILDCTKTIYNEKNAEHLALGGIERCIISLSRALSQKGYEVRVFSNQQDDAPYHHIQWAEKSMPTDFKADIVIACNDPKLFDLYEAQSNHKNFKAYLWHHNPVELWKTIRKGRLLPLLKWRPINIFLGKHHLQNSFTCLPSRKNIIIEHGVEDSVLNFQRDVSIPEPHAVFISQPYRGLKNVINLWKNFVFPSCPSAKLFIYSHFSPTDSDLEKFGIIVKGRLPRQELAVELSHKRVAIIPGHADETFCLSAIESLCLGLPVISFGIGSLSERIQDQSDGFIANNNEEFAQKILLLLKDDTLWQRMSKTAITRKSKASWAEKAEIWDNLFKGIQNVEK